MMTLLPYIILLCICICGFVLTLKISQFNLFDPVPLLFLGFSVSIFLALVGTLSWNMVSLTILPVAILLIGLCGAAGAAFFFQRVIAVHIDSSSDKPAVRKSLNAFQLDDPIWKYLVAVLLVAIAVSLRIHETYVIGNQLGFATNDFGSLSSQVRQVTESFIDSSAMKMNVGFSFAERQMEKVVWAIGFVGAYLVAQGIVSRNKNRLMPAAVVVLSTWLFYLIAGGRGTIIYQLIAILCTVFIGYCKNHEAKAVFKKVFVIGALVAIGAALCMYLASYIIGRPASGGPISYISFYFGGSVPSLELLIDGNFQADESILGINTFYSLFSPLFKFGVIDSYPNYSITWVFLNGYASNIFTCFARYYLDFGLIGVAILSFAASLLSTLFFRFGNKSGNYILGILIGYFSAFVFDSAREEFLFSRLISLSQILLILVIILMAIFFSNKVCLPKKTPKSLTEN
jgi:oligosaccharide repeat unit polymerase